MYIYMYISKNIYIGKNAQNNSDNLLQAVGGSKLAEIGPERALKA